MSIINRADLHRLIDELPESVLLEVARFLEFVRFKLDKQQSSPTLYTPVALGGLWNEVTITDEDIANIRQEIQSGLVSTFW